jgi:hypothetical protein
MHVYIARMVVAATVALLAFPAPAGATHVQCGDVITQTTALDSDLVCANAGQSYVGLTIAASDVTLWMNRHTIRSTSGYGTGVKVPAGFGYRNIQIRRGHFADWSRAIDLAAADSAVLKVSVTEPGYPVSPTSGFPDGRQIVVSGDRNYLASNFVDGSPRRYLDDDLVAIRGISIAGDDNYTWGNTFHDAQGIIGGGDRPRHVLNTIVGCGENDLSGAYGIIVRNYNGAVINRNVVTGCITDGIEVTASSGKLGGAVISLNQSYRNFNDGIVVHDPKASVGRNMVSDNYNFGIYSTRPGTTIRNNTTSNNGVGIYAVPGTVDGGGNRANDGCVNVQCTP